MVPIASAPVVPPAETIAAFCRKWMIVEFFLFGSILRGDFTPASDVDIFVDLAADAPWSLYEWTEMIEELRGLCGREIDLVEKWGCATPSAGTRYSTTARSPMQPEKADAAYLWDMLDAARAIRAFVAGKRCTTT